MKIPMAAAVLAACLLTPATSVADECRAQVGHWLDPASGKPLESESLLSRLTGEPRVVLLGESHATPAHHRWQAYTLAALHAHRADAMVGFEMLPRAAQPVLDDWSAGAITESELLQRSDWRNAWGYDAEHYLPLFHLARLHRLPTLALNVERELVAEVGREGWGAIPAARRAGLSDPAPAPAAYRERLAEVFAFKQSMGAEGAAHGGEPDEEALREIRASAEFQRFVEAQLTWDRAMAEVLANARRQRPRAVIVAIVGRGHAEFGHGIAHQLADLGVDSVAVLLPWSAAEACDQLPAGIADAVFVVDEEAEDPAPPRPLLGVLIDAADGGVRVTEVVDDSVAERSGLRAGDIIRDAAGFVTGSPRELVDIIRRQAPGTWLPLTVIRDGETLTITARFPRQFE